MGLEDENRGPEKSKDMKIKSEVGYHHQNERSSTILQTDLASSTRRNALDTFGKDRNEANKERRKKFYQDYHNINSSTTPRPGKGMGCQGHIENEPFAMGGVARSRK